MRKLVLLLLLSASVSLSPTRASAAFQARSSDGATAANDARGKTQQPPADKKPEQKKVAATAKPVAPASGAEGDHSGETNSLTDYYQVGLEHYQSKRFKEAAD